MPGGRAGGSVPKKDIVHRCTCAKQCSKEPGGYRDLKEKAYNRHKLEDELWRAHNSRQSAARQHPTDESQLLPTGQTTVDVGRIENININIEQGMSSQRHSSPSPSPPSQSRETLGTQSRFNSRAGSPDSDSAAGRDDGGNLNANNHMFLPFRHRSLSESSQVEPPAQAPMQNPAPIDQTAPPSRAPTPVMLSEQDVHLDPGETPEMFEPPTYVDEHLAIRLTYLRVTRLNTLNHLPVRAANLDLVSSLECLYSAGLEPPVNPPPARTIDTVRKRLGLDVDGFLRQQPICSECYQPFSYDEITRAEVNKCFRPTCRGIFWQLKSGKRQPVKVVVYTRLVAAIRRLMLRPDFLEGLELGRAAHGLHQPGVLDDCCDGTAWNDRQIGLRRIWRPDGRPVDQPVGGEAAGAPPRIIDLEYGLLASVNIDWFGITENHSLGAVYVCFLNLHRSMRYRPENTILACVIPGPGEPSLEQLNHVLDPIVEELKRLYAGIVMKIYEEEIPKFVKVHVCVHMLNADSPARAKTTGTGGHAHHSGFCQCDCEHKDINNEHGYDISAHTFKSETEVLRLARNSLLAPNRTEQRNLASEYGIRWSSFNNLPQWKPYESAPIDMMHNLYLGIVKSLWYLLGTCYYFTQPQREAFDIFTDSIEWPSDIGRLPRKLAVKGGLRKADEFRRLITVLPIALWATWKNQEDDSVPDHAEPIPETSNYQEDHVRSRKRILELTIFLSAASRLLASWSITLTDVTHAQSLLQRYCQGLLRLNITLQPNHHFAMHYERSFRLYGPAYAWWLFAHERFNGILEKVPINQHSEDYEMIMARFWTRLHRLHEMIQFLPASATDKERELIAEMCQSVGIRGTTLTTEAMLAKDVIYTTSKQPKLVNLHSLPVEGLYFLMLDFARLRWPDLLLTSDQEPAPGGYPFLYDRVAEALPFIHRNGVRFGCASATRTQADKFAFVELNDGNIPCQIEYLFRLTVSNRSPEICAVIAPLTADEDIPVMPWDEYAVELGAFTAYADRFAACQVVSVKKIIAPMALCKVQAQSTIPGQGVIELWIALHYDRTGAETTQPDRQNADNVAVTLG